MARTSILVAGAIGLVSLVAPIADAGSVILTKASFDAEVFESGKSAFVKFYAPW